MKKFAEYWLRGTLWFDEFLNAPSRRSREVVVTLLIVLLLVAALIGRQSS